MATSTLIIIGVVFLVAAIAFTYPKAVIGVSKILSEGITSISFLVIFVVFVAQIISRYFFKSSIGWSNEVSILGYMYCMYFGTGRALTADEHVVFSLVYDKLPNIGKLISKLVYNLAMIILLAITISPSYAALMKMTNVTGVLKMPYKVVFFPYMWMLIETIIRCALYMKTSVDEYKAACAESKAKKIEASKKEAEA